MGADIPDGRINMALLSMKLDYLITKVDIIDKRTEVHRERLARIEDAIRLLKWGGGILGTIAVALLVSWLKALFGV